jgi:hypothetical protein
VTGRRPPIATHTGVGGAAAIGARYRTLAPNAPLSGRHVEANLDGIDEFREVGTVSMLIDLLR